MGLCLFKVPGLFYYFVVWLGTLPCSALVIEERSELFLRSFLYIFWSRLHFQIVFLVMPSSYMWSGLWIVHGNTLAIPPSTSELLLYPGGYIPPTKDQNSYPDPHMHSSLSASARLPSTCLLSTPSRFSQSLYLLQSPMQGFPGFSNFHDSSWADLELIVDHLHICHILRLLGWSSEIAGWINIRLSFTPSQLIANRCL